MTAALHELLKGPAVTGVEFACWGGNRGVIEVTIRRSRPVHIIKGHGPDPEAALKDALRLYTEAVPRAQR